MKLFKRLSAILCTAMLMLSTQVATAGLIVFTDAHPQLNTRLGTKVSSLQVFSGPATSVTVGLPRQISLSSSRMIVVEKVETYWVKQPQGVGRVRVTVPVRYYLTAWDVQALERELERLGVKIKPRPMPPKPGPVSG